MIYFLYGLDTYRSRAKLREIVGEYRKKNEGVFDLHRFDAERDDTNLLRELATSQSLFVAKRLVVIERPAGDEFLKHLNTFLKGIQDDSNIFVVLWSDKGGKEADAIRKIAEPFHAKAVEFVPMTRAEAKRWLTAFLEKEALKISSRDTELLLDRFAGDTWRLANEAQKVAIGGIIGSSAPEKDDRIFALTDAFLLDAGAALRSLQKVRAGGANDFMIFGGISAHLRALLLVVDGEHQKLHPFVVKKAKEKIVRLGVERIRRAYEQMLDEDVKSKIGFSDPYASLVNLILAT